jgi:hypothetical protein
MSNKELNEALRKITKVLSNPRVDVGQRDQLLKVKRELAKLAQSGKLERRRVFLAVEIVAKVLLEIVEQEATQRPE